MKTWVKLYTEIIEDPDQGSLTLAERGVWSLFLALCGRLDDRDDSGNETGRLDTTERIAWYLRCDAAEIESASAAFVERGMVEAREGVLYLPHYAARQQRKPSAQPQAIRERVRRYREMKRDDTPADGANATPAKHPCNADVTPLKHPVTRSDTDADADIDSESDADAEPPQQQQPEQERAAALFTLIESAGIMIGGFQQELWLGLFEITTDMGVIREAFEEAGKSNNGPPTPRYIERILRRCQAEGLRPGQWKQGQSRASPAVDQDYMTPEAIEGNRIAFMSLPQEKRKELGLDGGP